jgi:hypothetical protein
LRDKVHAYLARHPPHRTSELSKAGAVLRAHLAVPTSETTFRRNMLAACPQILRGHHFLTSMGELRSTPDVMKAYLLCCTWMEDGAFSLSPVAIQASIHDAQALVRGE